MVELALVCAATRLVKSATATADLTNMLIGGHFLYLDEVDEFLELTSDVYVEDERECMCERKEKYEHKIEDVSVSLSYV